MIRMSSKLQLRLEKCYSIIFKQIFPCISQVNNGSGQAASWSALAGYLYYYQGFLCILQIRPFAVHYSADRTTEPLFTRLHVIYYILYTAPSPEKKWSGGIFEKSVSGVVKQ